MNYIIICVVYVYNIYTCLFKLILYLFVSFACFVFSTYTILIHYLYMTIPRVLRDYRPGLDAEVGSQVLC